MTRQPCGRSIWILVSGCLLAVGCGLPRGPSAWPKPLPLGSGMPAFRPDARPGGAGGGDQAAGRQAAEPTGVLTLPAALTAALRRNPELRAVAWSVRAREAERIQATLLPNPEMEVTAEDFGATGRLRGVSELELTVAVRQVFWVGGQRARQVRLAGLLGREAGWRYELARLAVLTRTTQAFLAVVVAQRLLELARREEALIRGVVRLFRERMAAGRIARQSADLLSTEVRLARVHLKQERLRGRLAIARQRLAAQWGGRRARFSRASGRLAGTVQVPPLEALLARVGQSPQVLAWQARLASRQAEVAVARAAAVPDLSVTGGVRVLPESRSLGFVVGLAMGLPFFDRNQGSIRAARFRVAVTRARLREARVRVIARVSEAHRRAITARVTLRRLETQILPKARTALSAAQEAYRSGKADFLAVLDAQRALVQLEVERLSAKAGLLVGLVELELLLGTPLRSRRGDPDARPAPGGASRDRRRP